ncbi:MAG: hypothetical protein U9R75_07290 [Candidatus Thermoplasmatota archaeon]|nr:hypothetical protein [Candidatus Thermoplasmatota archaeon]
MKMPYDHDLKRNDVKFKEQRPDHHMKAQIRLEANNAILEEVYIKLLSEKRISLLEDK